MAGTGFKLLQRRASPQRHFSEGSMSGAKVTNRSTFSPTPLAPHEVGSGPRNFDDSWGLPSPIVHGDVSGAPFVIRAADSSGERSSASILIERMYATRGYTTKPLPDEAGPNSVTLVAIDHHTTIGTLTVGFDSVTEGILADDLFGPEIDRLRSEGHRVCEFTKLALDATSGDSKPVLAALFNVAYLYAYKIRGVDTLLIEVNPRHARYYAGMLGFSVIGAKRLNRRVNAPAVLLSLDFSHTQEQIQKFGGRPEASSSERSLYPYSFSAREEAGILTRLHDRFRLQQRPSRPLSAKPWSMSAPVRQTPVQDGLAIHAV